MAVHRRGARKRRRPPSRARGVESSAQIGQTAAAFGDLNERIRLRAPEHCPTLCKSRGNFSTLQLKAARNDPRRSSTINEALPAHAGIIGLAFCRTRDCWYFQGRIPPKARSPTTPWSESVLVPPKSPPRRPNNQPWRGPFHKLGRANWRSRTTLRRSGSIRPEPDFFLQSRPCQFSPAMRRAGREIPPELRTSDHDFVPEAKSLPNRGDSYLQTQA